jgi:hypothetical protein
MKKRANGDKLRDGKYSFGDGNQKKVRQLIPTT